MKPEHYKELKEYLGLESETDAKLFEYLELEYSSMGPWGEKIITYLRAILSRNKRFNTYIQPSDMELFRKIVKDSMTVLEMRLEQYDNDKVQRENQFPDRGHDGR